MFMENSTESSIFQIIHDLNNALCVLQLELEFDGNKIVVNKIDEIIKMVKQLQFLLKSNVSI